MPTSYSSRTASASFRRGFTAELVAEQSARHFSVTGILLDKVRVFKGLRYAPTEQKHYSPP